MFVFSDAFIKRSGRFESFGMIFFIYPSGAAVLFARAVKRVEMSDKSAFRLPSAIAISFDKAVKMARSCNLKKP